MIELKNSKQTYLGSKDGRDHFALDCSVGAVQMFRGGEWVDIRPRFYYKNGKLRVKDAPYDLEVDPVTGERIFWPDPDDLDTYIWLPAHPLFYRLEKRIEERRVVMPSEKYEVRFILTNTGVGFEVLIKDAAALKLPLLLDVEAKGLDVDKLLKARTGLGIPRPRLIEADIGQEEIQERFLNWSPELGQLRLDFDPTGMILPALLKNTTLTLQVGASSDDADQDGTAVDLTATSCIITQEAADWMGARLTSVNIPSGATIGVNSYVEMECVRTLYDDPDMNIYCENGNNPGTFTTGASNISNRTRTSNFTYYQAAGIGAGWFGSQAITSIADEVQEVVDDNGGTGDALVVIIEAASTGAGHRCEVYLQDYDDNLHGLKAHIEYEAVAVGRVMGALAGQGGLAGSGGIAGRRGGIAG